MEIEEFNNTIKRMLKDANQIIHHQMIIAGVKKELNERRNHPNEQDFIYLDHYGYLPSEPIKHRIGNVEFTTRVLHQEGKQLSDIKGADLLYEIEGEKYILVQYKKADASGMIKVDSDQLKSLLKNCPQICYYQKKPRSYIPYKINGFCGCFYRVESWNTKKYFHACEINQIIGKKNSRNFSYFSSGISKNTFEELFATCRLGAMTKIKKSQHYIKELLLQNNFILQVIQSGRW